jgi:hypothetical protein
MQFLHNQFYDKHNIKMPLFPEVEITFGELVPHVGTWFFIAQPATLDLRQVNSALFMDSPCD